MAWSVILYIFFNLLLQVCEHYIGRGITSSYPDWTIAAAGTETNLKIGYEYGCSVAGVAHFEVDFNEEMAANETVPDIIDDIIDESSIVAMSAEVRLSINN